MTIAQRIQNDISTNRVMLFMKGIPEAPMCGFSNTVVEILKHLNIEFGSANVLEDMELREGIKEFSDWPTIPQLYVDANFIGGCDIVLEMYQSGELQPLLQVKDA
ncbi:MAG: Grx4 family monothiol glutaredoxin [Mariniblastus sp.]|jgi:monothiol glutaredoxin|nr:Grx4 family monothiol glutaredoxin [Mariniblastus sp.]